MAIGVVVVLFVAEIIVTTCRIVIVNPVFSPIIVTAVLYIVVAVVLTVAYIICAVAILNKIAGTGPAHAQVQKMTLRFSISTAGYIGVVLTEIAVYLVTGVPWGPQIAYYLLYAFLNFTATLQVVALRPMDKIKRSFTKGYRSGSASKSKSDSSTKVETEAV